LQTPFVVAAMVEHCLIGDPDGMKLLSSAKAASEREEG
jgi:hypothetical protein